MCTFARMVQLGRLPPPFSSTAAERWARTALIDDDELLAHPRRPARDQARRAGLPIEQIATRRRELELPHQQL
jgi:hypothetical protein